MLINVIVIAGNKLLMDILSGPQTNPGGGNGPHMEGVEGHITVGLTMYTTS